jgi:arylsulfatase A-like enzyme
MSTPNKPNILWLCTDQQRFDTIRALGNSHINTPHLDQLVAEGTSFSKAFCQSPVCSPSRASFLTGRYPRTTRCRQNGQQIPADEILLPKMFAEAGYRCGLAGKLHLSSCSDGKVEQRIEDGYEVFDWSHHPQPDWPENAYTQWLERKGTSWQQLYDQPDPEAKPTSNFIKRGVPAEYHQTTFCAEKTIEFIEESGRGDRPWFFSFNCFDPHHPFDPPPEYLQRYNPDDMPLPKHRAGELENKTTFQQLDHQWAHNNPGEFHSSALSERDQREVTAAYYAMCELIDDQLGRILQALEESGQRDHTVLIFMSDHGEMLGDHGLYFKGPHFYDQAIRVPLILRWPGHFQAGRQVDDLVELVDLAPTLLEAANIPPPPDRLQGRSLIPSLTGSTAAPLPPRDFVFCEYYNSWTHPDAYATMIRTHGEKIVVYHGSDQGELYDLKNDPGEFHNLWNDPSQTERKLRLLKQCFDASVFSMDPTPPRLGAF